MDCLEAKPLMDDLLDGDLDASSRRALEQHLTLCEACDQRYEELLAVERWAGNLEPEMPAPDFADAVMARIAEEEQPAAAGVIGTDYGIAYVFGALAGLLIVSAILNGVETVSGWYSTASATVGDALGAASTDVTAVGGEALATVGTLTKSLEPYQSSLSPVWLLVAAAGAFILMVLFNYTQTRAVRRGSR